MSIREFLFKALTIACGIIVAAFSLVAMVGIAAEMGFRL
jgi:hypothetical protein